MTKQTDSYEPIAMEKSSIKLGIIGGGVMGEAIFGMGWGLGLLCPGPALYHATANPMVLFRWLPAFAVGAVMAQEVKAKQQ